MQCHVAPARESNYASGQSALLRLPPHGGPRATKSVGVGSDLGAQGSLASPLVLRRTYLFLDVLRDVLYYRISFCSPILFT